MAVLVCFEGENFDLACQPGMEVGESVNRRQKGMQQDPYPRRRECLFGGWISHHHIKAINYGSREFRET